MIQVHVLLIREVGVWELLTDHLGQFMGQEAVFVAGLDAPKPFPLLEVEMIVIDFELLKLLVEPLQRGPVQLLDDLYFEYLVLALFNPRLELGPEVVLGEGAANVGVVFEVEEGLGVHRHKRLEELLIAVEVLFVDLNVETRLDLVQVFHLV